MRRWSRFCVREQVDTANPTINHVLDFLTDYFHTGVGYSAVATARSALAGVVHIPGVPDLAKHPLVKRLLKAVFNLRPPKPRYAYIWDAQIIVDYLRSLDNSNISFKMLSLKLTTLLTLLSGQRVSTLENVSRSLLQITPNKAIFQLSEKLKQSRPHITIKPFIFHAYTHDTNLCPIATIGHYLSARAQVLHQNQQPDHEKFFIFHRKPNQPASVDTLARWVKETMHLSGIDTSIFKAHSCRSASSSKASLSVSLESILKAGQWSQHSTFYTYYRKDICVTPLSNQDFADSILPDPQ